MGNSGALFVTLLVVGIMAVNAAKVFKVGGYNGWLEPDEGNYPIYNDWASSQRFHIGDSLFFEYKEGDSVMVVDKWSYYHCSAANLIVEFTNGNSTFVLDRPGPFYFISGAVNNCKNGQRLLVEVIHPKSPPDFANPPEGADHFTPASWLTSAAPASRPQGLALALVVGALSVLSMCVGFYSPLKNLYYF